MRRLFLVLSVSFLSGCFAHAPIKNEGLPGPVVSGNLVDIPKLKAGGKVGFMPFKAGPRAEANDQLDRLSLMLIKGIGDALQEQKTNLTVTQQEEEADFVVDGYIEEFSRARFSISGALWRRDVGERALTFASSRNIKAKKQDPMGTAYQMGMDIGRFIAANAAKE